MQPFLPLACLCSSSAVNVFHQTTLEMLLLTDMALRANTVLQRNILPFLNIYLKRSRDFDG